MLVRISSPHSQYLAHFEKIRRVTASSSQRILDFSALSLSVATEAKKFFALRYCDCKTNANTGTQRVHEKVNEPPVAPGNRQLDQLDRG